MSDDARSGEERGAIRARLVTHASALGRIRIHRGQAVLGIVSGSAALVVILVGPARQWSLGWRVALGVAALALLVGTVNYLWWLWRTRWDPALPTHGQYTPPIWKVSRSLPVAILIAVLAMWGLFHILENFGEIDERGALAPPTVTDVMQAAIAVLSPVAAMIAAVFLYRRSKMNLSESRRADGEQYQRRFVEAATLLGNINAAVRIAGVIAMATLARDWEEQRQKCIDVLCAYMRIPPIGWQWDKSESKQPPPIPDDGEAEVRYTVTAELRELLRCFKGSRGLEIRLNLRGAIFGLSYFREVQFGPHVVFDDAIFAGKADFKGAFFTESARFRGVAFADTTNFRRAVILGYCGLEGAAFYGPAHFDDARIEGPALFSNASFGNQATFTNTAFCGIAFFMKSLFAGMASFTNATFAVEHSLPGLPSPFRLDSLGPLASGSERPKPSGTFVDNAGNIIGEVEWIVEGDTASSDEKPPKKAPKG